MSRPWKYLAVLMTLLLGTQAFAQDQQELEKLAKHLEKIAEKAASQAEKGLEEQYEKIIEQHGAELEQWAEAYSKDWEKWAERFESKMEAMAKQQEATWEKWAKQYSQKWEQWDEKLQKGELKPAELERLIEQNLSLMSEMPIREMIEKSVQGAMGELESAPWKSLEELEVLIESALEKSLHQLESTRPEDAGKKAKAYWEKLAKLEQQLVGETYDEAKIKDKLSKLHEVLNSSKLGAEQKRAVEEALKLHEEFARSNAKEHLHLHLKALKEHSKLSEATPLRESHLHLKEAHAQQMLQMDRARAEQLAALKMKEMAQKKSAEAAKKMRDRAKKQQNSNLKSAYLELQKQVIDVESRSRELEEMRREIQKLREEIRELKKDK